MNLVSHPFPESASRDRRAALEAQLREATAQPEIVPLSFAQQRLWVLDQLEPNSALYNVPLALELTGALDVSALEKALNQLVLRHEVLRTRFASTEEMPVQVVEESGQAVVVLHELTHLAPELREQEAGRLMREDVNRPFDLTTGPLMRVLLLRLAPDRHRLLLNFHHIVSDEWSLKICLRELTHLYDCFRRGRVSALPELPIQYADYALWQRDRLAGELAERQLAYWRTQLQGTPAPLELPADFPRPATPGFRGSTISHPLASPLHAGLKDVAGRSGTSLFMVLLAAFKALLHRYTQQTDIVVGSPIAGRNQLETEDLIGFFVNTLVLRTTFDGDPRFTELLARVRETTLGAYANQDLPFERLVEALRPERTLNHNPFTRLMFAVQSGGLDSPWPGLQTRLLDVHTDTAKFDLTLVVLQSDAGLVARAEFNSDLFRAETIQRLLGHFESVLAAIAADPQRRLSELPLLTEAEKRLLLHDWNATATAFPRDQGVPQLFEAQVDRTPNAVAVTCGQQSLTYAELNARANQLARHLLKLGVGPDVTVGLCMERSPSLVVGMLAILKAGGAYVPLDPGYPKPRLAHMLNDSKATVLLTQQRLLTCLPRSNARVVCFNSDWDLITKESRDNLPNKARPENLAYVMYTSGSTGQPKGVGIPHRAIARLVLNTNYIQLSGADRIAQASNTSFDAATFEIWGALLNGARLVGISTDVALSPADFARELREQQISVLFLTTALFNQIAADQPDAFQGARVVMFGGEAVDPKWVRAVLKHRPKHLLHVYGPTENTTFSTWHEIQEVPEDAWTVPIGRPLANSQCFVLDAHLNPVPVGVPGELYVSGDGLARGYWQQPELTAQKFVLWHPDDGERAGNGQNEGNVSATDSRRVRLYRTGDLVRWRPDGTIEFLGRTDSQVKLRGFRVELGEIESVLTQHSAIRDCVAAVYRNEHGDRQLVAYFVPNGRRAPGHSELRQHLKQKLPDYMVPASFVKLDALPLTPNGKVDRHALPGPERARPDLGKRYATPEDAVEVELTRIWESVLGIKPVGIEDKFFELGGHSLLAVRVIAQIERQFGRKLKLATIFQAQTIEQLAAILRKEIQEDSAISGTSIVEIQPKGTRPPLFLVHGAGGGMFWGYVNLSRHLGQDQPVFGLRSRGLDGREEFPTIERMAEQYLADIRVVQPHGPYHIGGYCFGGNVAYEMARQLQARGEEVRLLALFNCAPANSSYSRLSYSPSWFLRFGVNLCYWGRYFMNWTPEQRREFFRWKREMLQRRMNRYLGNEPRQKATVDAGELVDLSSFNEEQRRLWESHIQALVNYHPRPFSGRVHLFRSPGHPMLCSFEADYGWGGLAQGGVEIRIVPGVHEKILEEPCVETLATALSDALRESHAPSPTTPIADSPMPNTQTITDLPSSTPAIPGRKNHSPFAPQLRPNVSDAGFNLASEKPYPHYFEARAAHQPDALALRFLDQECTYAELNARANQLAHRLQALGIGRDTLVAVCLERSLDLPITLLAVLKAGAAYLPLDRSYPSERLAYMLQDSRARVLVTHRRSMPPLNATPQLVCLDDPAEQRTLQQLPTANPECPATAGDLAYVIYTSGSTGKPKGVEITHRSLLNHNFAMGRIFKLTPGDRVLQFSPYSFDISIEEIFPTWLHGAALVMRTDDVLSSTERFFGFVRDEQLSVLNLPTAYWHELVEYSRTADLPPSLRLVVIGGERASDEAWRRWKIRAGDRVVLINTYGPTETTVSATLHVGQPHEETLPIGRPLDNVHTLILDAGLQPVPEGDTGELFIGGAGVARGYLNRPELTEQKFIRNPFPHVPGERLYRTGDLVRLRADGELEFVGRADEQVKIRGYRIELGEIESALRGHPDLKEAVVVAREDAPGKKKLVAYYLPREGAELHVNDVRHFLKDKLPSYMVPAALVPLEAFPMTPGGKVDRKALPPPGDDRPELDSQYTAPRTPLEEIIAGIWADVLRLKRVGIEDNFFDLGGHSLLATQVISRLRETLQVEVPLGDLFDFPTVASLAAHLSANSATQPVLPMSAVSKGRTLPLTPAQMRLWFLDLFEPEQLSYNITTSIRLTGPLNVAALERSLTELSRRHEALRTIFSTDNGQPVQIVCEPSEVRLPVADLSPLPAAEREPRALAEAAQEGRKSYVTSAPMLRPFLWRFADDDHLLLLMTHELASDGASVQLMFEELTLLYEAFARDAKPELPVPEVSYSEITHRLIRNWDPAPEKIEFWKRQLAGAPPVLNLPSDRPRPKHQSEQGACHSFEIDARTAAQLEALAQQERCEPATVLLAIFQCLLARYTGATDLVVGVQTSRRTPELRGLVANFDNTAPVRAGLSGDPAFAEALARVKASHTAALAHRDVPFETLVRELQPPREPRHMPIVQVMFTYDPKPLAERRCGSLRLVPSRTHNQTSKLDLWLYVGRAADGFNASFEYSTALFDPDRIARMAEHFRNLLRGVLANPGQRLSEFELLGEAERQRLLEWGTSSPVDSQTTILALFDEQARLNPDSAAVLAGDDRLTYAGLAARAGHVAQLLLRRGITTGARVGVCVDRSPDSVAAILGTLKSGAVCVPLDPHCPSERLKFIVQDAGLTAVLAGDAPAGRFEQLSVPTLRCAAEVPSDILPCPTIATAELAFILYTSHPSGQPVGISIEHRSMGAIANWMKENFTRDELRGVFASTPVCSSGFLLESLAPLAAGGTVVLADGIQSLPGMAGDAELALLPATPGDVRELLRIKGIPATVRTVILTGEPAATELIDELLGETQVQKVWDVYGCTETAGIASATIRTATTPANAGRPIKGATVVVLDAHGVPTPTGVPGEIHVSGETLARGCWNRSEASEAFVTLPHFEPHRMFLKTGDLGRWRADGTLEILGRRDRRLRLHGARVELTEVEAVLKRHPACAEAVALIQTDGHGHRRLIACATAKPGASVNGDELRRHARQWLPDHVLPSALIVMKALPRTASGEIDRQRLLEPERHHRPPHLEPRGPVEQQLASIWREVLGVERVGLRDNFFELGGDSMLAVRMLARARETFKVDLPIYSIFEAPTVESLALGLTCGQWTRNQFPMLPLEPVPRHGALPALPMQAGLWFIDQLEPGNPTYNVPTLVRLEGALDIPCLTRALEELARRHEALRTTFAFTEGRLTQVIHAPSPVELALTDFTREADAKACARQLATEDADQVFDLERGPLMRCRLIRVSDQEHWFVVVMHHAISDGCSVAIFFSELEALYNAGLAGNDAVLPDLPVQYADYAAWHNAWMSGPLLEKELDFWKERLSGAPTAIALPADFPVPESPTRSCQSCFIDLPAPLVKGMNALAQREGFTPYILMMTALSLVMRKWTGQTDIVLGAVAAGRNRREIEDVIGCFINFLPVRIRHGEEGTGQELLQRVKAAVLEAQAHQDCPFEKIVEAMNPERKQLQNPLYNVTLLLQNFARIAFDPRGLKSRFERLAPDASPVDLEFEVEESETGLAVKCDFRVDLFRRETAGQLLLAFRETLESLVNNPQARLDSIELPAGLAAQAREARSRETGLTLAIAATFTAEPLEESLRYWASELELPLRLEFAGFQQVFQELLTPGSLFNTNARGMNVLLLRPEDWFKSGDASANPDVLRDVAQDFLSALASAAAKTAVPFLVSICPRSAALAADARRAAIVDSVEALLAGEAEKLANVHVVTPGQLAERYAVADYDDASGDELGHVPYTPVFFTALGTMIVRKFHALQRSQPKVIVLDCDNTLWSGVCGEDGAQGICIDEPRLALQKFMRAQLEAGRLLAVCSKNNEEDVREVFAKRLDMPLRHEHFVAWRTNWLPKSENLKSLAQELNLGLDSFVFVDDNPVECAEVEANCPQVLTLQLPDDPGRIPGFLHHCWIFDPAKLTAEDRKRGEMYRENRQREQLRSQSQSLGDFIASLKLEIEIAPATPAQLPRVSQLTHRTNQFNCTTVRRSETEIQQLTRNADIFAVSVRDRFGDYGLVGVLIATAKGDKLEVETFLLSCRVLGRGVEHAMLARMGTLAKERGLAWVDVHFNRSEKNKPAFEFLQKVGADHRQALNGGFIYRFPAAAAAAIAFKPEAANDLAAASKPDEKTASNGKSEPAVLFGNRFRRYRAVALEAADAAVIHAAIEAKASRRQSRQSDYVPPEGELEQQLCTLWQDLLRVDRVGRHDNFFELGGHSLLAVRLFADLEKLAGRKFPLVTVFQAPTVRELAQVLSEGRDAVAQSPIVPVQTGGSRPPLFLAHGAGGDVLWGYANLAKHLPPEQPLYGIKSRGQIGLEEFDRIEDMARYYIGEIRKIQPRGPYYVGGYCLGGNVAYEMARQLRAAGEEVALVALIDAFPSNAGYERVTWWQPTFAFRFLRNVWYWLDDFKDLTGHEQRRFFARKARILGRKAARVLRGKPADAKDEVDLEEVIDPTFFPEHELKFWEIHIRALVNHVEQPYPGAVTLIRTRGQPFLCSFAEDFCWGKLARGGVKLRQIPGSHENIFMDPNVRQLARVLDTALAESQPATNAPQTAQVVHEAA